MIVASMLFGLFFGAGNLIFPVRMGQLAGSHTISAAAGFCITGVGLPLLGVAAMAVSGSEGLFHMSSRAGRWFAYFFTCALYLTIGPLFAIPRTATVSFQVGVNPLIPGEHQSLFLFFFSLAFFAVVLFFSLRPSEILTWVGKVLNPIFLVLLAVLFVTAWFRPMGNMGAAAPAGAYSEGAFFKGFLEGYNTMDALASLAFGIILIDAVRSLGVKERGRVSVCAVKSGVLSTLLMAFIYFALAVVGAQSAAVTGVSPDGGTALFEIAKHYFGTGGGIFLGVMITVACIKTAIGLITALGTTFSQLFPKIFTYNRCAVLFCLISFVIANAGLNAILTVSLPVLMFLYPVTIVLIMLCLFGNLFNYDRCIFSTTIIFTILSALLSLAESIQSEFVSSVPAVNMLVGFYHRMPFSGIGMGWILPSAAGFAAGCILAFVKCRRKAG